MDNDDELHGWVDPEGFDEVDSDDDVDEGAMGDA